MSPVVIICIRVICIPLEEKFLRYLKDYDKYNLNAYIYLYFMLIFRLVLLYSHTWMCRKYIIFSYCPLLRHLWMLVCLFKAHLLKSLVCSYWPAPTGLSKHRHHPFCFCIMWPRLLLNVVDGWCSIKLSFHKILLKIWQKVRTDYRIVQYFFSFPFLCVNIKNLSTAARSANLPINKCLKIESSFAIPQASPLSVNAWFQWL